MAEVVASLGKATSLRLGGAGPRGLATLGEELSMKLRLASLLSFSSTPDQSVWSAAQMHTHGQWRLNRIA